MDPFGPYFDTPEWPHLSPNSPEISLTVKMAQSKRKIESGMDQIDGNAYNYRTCQVAF